MSHLRERKERNCLNCNAQLYGKYCHVCGQENIEPHETVWNLVSHFFEDITHFDGKFFSTLKWLVFRPGFLSREYLLGRRASYLNPVRMYVFTSAFFFLVFFSLFRVEDTKISEQAINAQNLSSIAKMDSARFADFTRSINRGLKNSDVPMTRNEFSRYADSMIKNSGLTVFNHRFRNKEAYDSALASGVVKDGWFTRQIVYHVIAINEKYNYDIRRIMDAFSTSLLHSLPQMLFLSLPLLALILKLLYIRRRQFYYVNHAIFSIHFYIFLFIAMLVLFALDRINQNLHWGALSFLMTFLSLGLFFYEYKAMRNFYGQRRGKTLVKFLLLNFMLIFVILLLFVAFLFFSLFKL